MIKNIKVTNSKDESIVLELAKPEKSGLIVKSITGLMPGEATINYTELATSDGGIYNSSRKSPRNIVVTLMMMYYPTIEDSRHIMYTYFEIKKKVTLEIETDKRWSEITGYVENIDGDIFTDREEAQISIICPDPWFYAVGGSGGLFSGTLPKFEFPFSNESLTDDLLEFGEIRMDTRTTLFYKGDVDTGVKIKLNLYSTIGDVDIYNTDTREHMKIYINEIKKISGITPDRGDEIIINTISGQKYAQFYHDGFHTNIINAIDKNSDWFKISKGDNVFQFTATENEENIMMTFEFRNAYGGI